MTSEEQQQLIDLGLEKQKELAARAYWETHTAEEKEIGGFKIRVCVIPFCDRPVYSKNMCAAHYQQARLGRLDPVTGGAYAKGFTSKVTIDKPPLEEIKALPNMGDLKDWVYIMQTEEFVEKASLSRYKLNAMIAANGEVVRALIRNRKFEIFKRQEFIVYNPHDYETHVDDDDGHVLNAPKIPDGVYNTFTPDRMMWAKNSEFTALSTPMKTLISTLAGEEIEYFEKWLAWTVRKVGTPGCALILRGIHGSGKSVFSALMKTVFGPYATTIRVADIENNHNSWLEDKLMIFGEEMAAGGFREQIKTMNELKKYISGGQTLVNRKMVPQYPINVCARWMLFSNAQKPLVMEATERRYSVIESLKLLPQEVGKEIDDNKEKYAQELLDYLHTVELNDFSAWKQLQNESLRKIKESSKIYFEQE